ncbi:hypothetical protein [Cellulomonas sp. ES6]|uniref:hypothetical protein n=1 Tax=Cellulomonas sp. ES6 TaxID=3039384 RepID=UPI0024B63F7D|nr:hypothetical protein [Cellulomonas sp. ES6]WHP18806.1 hypothetical protein P9841_06735 [Cellulomonas sp. ES6]
MDISLPWYLKTALGRDVQREEIALAIGASISTVTRRMRDGFPVDEIIQAARYFGLSPLDALVQLGYLKSSEVGQLVVMKDLSDYTDVELATEMLRRASERSTTSGVAMPPADQVDESASSNVYVRVPGGAGIYIEATGRRLPAVVSLEGGSSGLMTAIERSSRTGDDAGLEAALDALELYAEEHRGDWESWQRAHDRDRDRSRG